jgi:hypothetical protein
MRAHEQPEQGAEQSLWASNQAFLRTPIDVPHRPR